MQMFAVNMTCTGIRDKQVVTRTTNHQNAQQQLWHMMDRHRTKWHLPLACQSLYLYRCLWLAGLNAGLSTREKHKRSRASETTPIQADILMAYRFSFRPSPEWFHCA